MNWITAIPVYDEERHLKGVLQEVQRYSPNILVVNDGSTDDTARILKRFTRGKPIVALGRGKFEVITHAINGGYGAALISAFQYALAHDVEVLVTMDCDG